MNDYLPEDTALWQRIEGTLKQVLGGYGYSEIRMPIVEQTPLFKRAIGEVTDVVEKEMYSFEDRNGESLTLRPEGTAGCVRAGIEHVCCTIRNNVCGTSARCSATNARKKDAIVSLISWVSKSLVCKARISMRN